MFDSIFIFILDRPSRLEDSPTFGDVVEDTSCLFKTSADSSDFFLFNFNSFDLFVGEQAVIEVFPFEAVFDPVLELFLLLGGGMRWRVKFFAEVVFRNNVSRAFGGPIVIVKHENLKVNIFNKVNKSIRFQKTFV